MSDMRPPDIAVLLAASDPGMKTMDPNRTVHGTQDQWATKDDQYRFGWNACRAEMLNRLEAALERFITVVT